MKKLIFILGGARSGKSNYALELAKRSAEKVIFVATAAASDDEMKERIRKHKLSRPKHWKTIEEKNNISGCLSSLKGKCDAVILDCLGLWISNLMAENLKDKEIEKEIKKLAAVLSKLNLICIVVSNEVGSGIVPDNYLSRRFRDLVGITNQVMAGCADEVIFMHAGIPMEIKDI